MYTHTHVHAYTYIYTFMCTYVCTIYMYMCIYIYKTHTQKYSSAIERNRTPLCTATGMNLKNVMPNEKARFKRSYIV